MLTRPHIEATSGFYSSRIDWDRIRAVGPEITWEAIVQLLQKEAEEVYGWSGIKSDTITYSTKEHTASFTNTLSQKMFERVVAHDSYVKQATVLRTEHEAIEAAKPPPEETKPVLDDNGEPIPPKPKSKRQMREEAEQRKKDTERLRALLEAEHKVECAAIPLTNAFKVFAVRVERDV